MEITITTPALLFPAISLLLLAYTNRFLALASLVRNLHSIYKERHESMIILQIKSLRKRIILIRFMQATGVLSLFICVFCMLLLLSGIILLAKFLFAISLILLMVSLSFSVWEIQISSEALNMHLSDLEEVR